MAVSSTSKSRTTDWTKCCICQLDKKEDLKSPQTNPVKKGDDGYVTMARNIPRFQSLHQLPINIDPARLDEGGGIEETLRRNKAHYHETCRLLFNNTNLQRAEKRSTPAATRNEGGRSNIPRKAQEKKKIECFLCETQGDELREAMTMKVNMRINECARTLNDGKLLAKLSGGDVIAQDLKNHSACLVALYNKERDYLRVQEQERAQENWKEAYPIAFSELVTHISEIKAASDGTDPPIFRLADLTTLYKQRLEQLGVESPQVHATRLKDQLLCHIPELQAHHQG